MRERFFHEKLLNPVFWRKSNSQRVERSWPGTRLLRDWVHVGNWGPLSSIETLAGSLDSYRDLSHCVS